MSVRRSSFSSSFTGVSGEAVAGPSTLLQRPQADGVDTMTRSRGNPASRRLETSTLPPPAPWTAAERLRYGLHGLVSWSRHLVGVSSKEADAAAVAQFLLEKSIWLGNAPVNGVSDRSLKRMDIERKFWWINQSQIVSLASTISAFAARSNTTSREKINDLVFKALFGNKEENI